VGIEKVQVSSKMDEANALFLDWLTKLGKPFPTSRSWWNNECISLVRMLVRSGQIGLPLSSLQGIPRVCDVIPSLPLSATVNETGPAPNPTAIQARLSFFSRLVADADQGSVASGNTSLRFTFAYFSTRRGA